MRAHVGPLLAVALGLFGARCREAPITAPRPITSLPRALDAGESSLIGADNRFAFKLFGEIARQASPDSNLFISPLRSEEHTSELQSLAYLVCRLLLEK